MSLKKEIETWAAALEAYDAQDFDGALGLFDEIADTSRIHFNIGLILATCGRHEEAVAAFRRATELDTFFAVAFFQCGVSNFLLQRYDEARADFDDAYQHLRGNLTIDYEQLGLKFRLYSCEVLFNRGLCSIYLGDEELGMSDLAVARTEKQTEEHGVIDEAIAERGDGFTVYSCPVSILFRPSEGKLRNVKTKNYLGEARLVAATEARDAFVGFTGSTRKALEGGRPVSTGPNAPLLTATVNGLNRAKTAAVAEVRPTGATALRRRPTDTSASVTLARSASAGPTAGPSSPLAPASRPTLQRSATTSGPRQLPTSPERGLGAGAVAGERGMHTPPRTATPLSSYGESGSVLGDYAAYIDGGAVENEGENRFSRPKPRPALLPPAPLAPRRTDTTASPQGQSRDRVAAWAQKTAAAPTLQRTASSAQRQGTIVRRGTSRRNVSSPTSRRRYDEDEEGYGSADFDDASTVIYELARIRVKLHHEGDVRGMSITPDIVHDDLVRRVIAKLGVPEPMLKYRDDDGAMISIVDEDDWASAVDSARETAQGRPESKLEIFVA